jgi:hypothetical protein
MAEKDRKREKDKKASYSPPQLKKGKKLTDITAGNLPTT